MSKEKIPVVDRLNADQGKRNWEEFSKYLLKSKAKYYKVFYPKKVKKAKDLESAFAVIYDAKYTPMFRVPIVLKEGKKIGGATIYFKDLLNTNKDYKEWIA